MKRRAAGTPYSAPTTSRSLGDRSANPPISNSASSSRKCGKCWIWAIDPHPMTPIFNRCGTWSTQPRNQLGIQKIAQGIAEQICCQDGEGDRGARKDDQPPGWLERLGQDAAEHVAEARCGRRHAHPQEAERGFGKNRRSEI